MDRAHVLLCARLIVLASVSADATRATRHPEHRAAARAYLSALQLAEKDAPGLLRAAAQVLDDDAVGGAVLSNQFRAPKAAKLARYLIVNLGLGPQHFDDGVLVAEVDGQEAIHRAAEAHGAAQKAAHAPDAATATTGGEA